LSNIATDIPTTRITANTGAITKILLFIVISRLMFYYINMLQSYSYILEKDYFYIRFI
jgi:hypothetical protein